jgi:glycosyltransferase involved in cell wall biosynthesis
MKVSVIVPLYNAEKFIAETIESIINQSYKNWELIIVDDGSTDKSLEIVRSFESKKIKVFSQPNKGASAARNYGLEQSTGEYIQYLDADDILASNKFETQVNLLQSSSPDCITSCAWGRFQNSVSQAQFKPEKVWSDYSPINWLIDSWEGHGMMQTACWLTPRTVIEKAGLWNEDLSLNDDGEYFCRVLLNSSGIRFASNTAVYYRSGLSSSLSQQRSINAKISAFKVCESYREQMLAVCDTPQTRHAIMLNYLRFIYEFYPSPKELMNQSFDCIKVLGYENLELLGGKKFQLLARLIGLKLALKLRTLIKSN